MDDDMTTPTSPPARCSCERDAELKAQGAAEQRAAIVAWLRERQDQDPSGALEKAADEIEAGECGARHG